MTDKIQVSGIALRSVGHHTLIVEAEVDGVWVPVISEHAEEVGGAISHIVEPGGIQSALDNMRKGP